MKSVDFGEFEITAREVIASVVIISIMILFGITISNAITQEMLDKNEIYNKAVKIETAELFEYGMRTNVGNAFVSGDLKAVDTVSYPDINGEYMYIERIKERYTKHTRTVSHTRTVNGKTQTYYTTETYWTWDRVGSESKHSNQISFNGVIFDYGKIQKPGASYLGLKKESSHIRYKYYGTDTEFTGTIFTELKDNTISDNSPFYNDKTVFEAYELVLQKYNAVIFWFFWIIVTGMLVFGFYYIDNRWLY